MAKNNNYIDFEKYALLSLFYCGVSEKFIVADNPDLQTLDNSIGIEVTRCTSDIYNSVMWNKYHGVNGFNMSADEFRKLPEIKAIYKNGKQKFTAEVFDYDVNGRNSIGFSWGGKVPDKIDDVLIAIKTKIKKSKNYKEFQKMGVYLFIDSNHKRSNLDNKIKTLQQTIGVADNPFNFYILNLQDELFVIEKDTYKRFPFDTEARSELVEKCRLI